MLNKLLRFGVDHGYFELCSIKDMPKSCCLAETDAIDFDKTKEVILKSINTGTYKLLDPKSCDALKIIPMRNRLDFIEIKGIREFIKRLPKDNSASKAIDNKIGKFNFKKKIADSIFILNLILKNEKFSITLEEEKELNLVNKNYLIVVDIDIEKNQIQKLALTLQFLSEESSTDMMLDRMKKECEKIGIYCDFSKPRLISSKDIDPYYDEILERKSAM